MPARTNDASMGLPTKDGTFGDAACNAGYAPLDSILGGLHRERVSRLSTNRPPSGGESSMHSMGSEDARSGIIGGPYRSLPTNVHAGGFGMAGSWNAPPNARPKPRYVRPAAAMDEDDEMEDADGAFVAAAGSFGGSVGGSRVGGGSVGSGAGGAAVVGSRAAVRGQSKDAIDDAEDGSF